MKQKLLWMVFALATAAQGASLDAETSYPPELKPVQQEAQAAHLAAEVLARYHYKRMRARRRFVGEDIRPISEIP